MAREMKITEGRVKDRGKKWFVAKRKNVFTI